MSRLFRRRLGSCAASALIATTLVATGGGAAFASSATCYGTTDQDAAMTINSNILTTYGVRAGSAGGDYLGINNTNFDFTAGSASATSQYTGYQDDEVSDDSYTGISIWGTSVNESPNPYYWNLISNQMGTSTSATQATTWMKNPSTSSWGDTDTALNNGQAGMEFGGPDIVFGASKYNNWNDVTGSGTNFYTNDQNSTTFNPVYANNDATNIWTQIYTEGQLATKANTVTGKTTRYGSATTAAVNYEKAIRGNMLYVASMLKTGNDDTDETHVNKKTVAYLYAINGNNAYFFIPEADGLINGNDTGRGSAANAGSLIQSGADSNYAANNSTINMSYMATLPFITNTFTGKDSTTATGYVDGVSENNIVMKVEDIYKSNPAVKVTDSNVLDNVDVIIYNTNSDLFSEGEKGGKNLSGVLNSANLTETVVSNWISSHDSNSNTSFSGRIIAGDDFGTSTKQNSEVTNQAPKLYCQRNYTMDKNARAAWAFSKVYPELYGNNENASYGYWLEKVYHIKLAQIPTVGAKLTNQQSSSDFVYDSTVSSNVEGYIQTGFTNRGNVISAGVNDYYTGSSRASFYNQTDTPSIANEPSGTIGIFTPSALWISAEAASTTQVSALSSNENDDNSVVDIDAANADELYEYELEGFATVSMDMENRVVTINPTKDSDGVFGSTFASAFAKSFQNGYWEDVSSDNRVTLVFGSGVRVIRSTMYCIGSRFNKVVFPETLVVLETESVRSQSGISFNDIEIKGVEDGTSNLLYIGQEALKYSVDLDGGEIEKIKIPSRTLVASNAITSVVKEKLFVTSENAFERVSGDKSITNIFEDSSTYDTMMELLGEQKLEDVIADANLLATVKSDLETANATIQSQKELIESTPAQLKSQAITLTTYKSTKAKTVKKKAKSFKVASAKGKVTVKKIKGSKKLKIKNGKVVVKKGTKKGVYTIKVKVSAAATSAYAAASTTATITVVVK